MKLRRSPIKDGPAKPAELRRRALAILIKGSALGSVGVAANLLVTYAILLASRILGVSATELSAAEAFAAFAIAFWPGAVIPITDSRLGVVDAALITMLIEFRSARGETLLAAALLWRVFYSIIPTAARSDHADPLPPRNPDSPPDPRA